MTKFEPRITIVARCANGHETFMFPETCVEIRNVRDLAEVPYVVWECPVCPNGEHEYEVSL